MVSYDGSNHEQMVKTRAQKIANVVEDVPDAEVFGKPTGDLLHGLLGWHLRRRPRRRRGRSTGRGRT